MFDSDIMEIFNYNTLSFIILNFAALCLVSYFIYYKRYRTTSNVQSDSTNNIEQTTQPKQTEAKKPKTLKKQNQRKIKPPLKKRKTSATDSGNVSDTESYTLEEQLAQTIMSQQLTHDVINITAVNAKPTIKKFEQTSAKTKHGNVVKNSVFIRDEDWESVVSRKHKKKLYPVSRLEGGTSFSFTLDEEGGIVELQMCEIYFPPESVTRPLDVTIEFESYKKFVDDTEERVYLTPAVYFTVANGYSLLERKFTMRLNTKRMMGRGWDGNVCCQIETKDTDESWISTGRTEYLFGKPVHIVSDELTSYRAVLTRGHNGAISRDLNIAAYIAKPRQQNPEFHIVHLCVYDRSDQSKYKMEMNMQNLLVKMPPKTCNVTFGSDLQFLIKPTQKYSPDEKDVFMRWAEVCKAFVNVKFQIRLTRNETDDPNFEADFRSVVYLDILKVSPTATVTQEEYFHFYWISATFFPKKKNKTKNRPISENNDKGNSGNSTSKSSFKKLDSTKAHSKDDLKITTANQNIPIESAPAEKDDKRKRKRSKKISQSSSTTALTQEKDKNIFASENHILSKKTNVQSTSTNRKPAQVNHDRDSTNQKGATTFQKLPQKIGKDAKNMQYLNNSSNQVQSRKASQENHPQTSSTTFSQDSSKNRESTMQNTSKSSHDVTSKPFRRIFRYQSPSKKRVKNGEPQKNEYDSKVEPPKDNKKKKDFASKDVPNTTPASGLQSSDLKASKLSKNPENGKNLKMVSDNSLVKQSDASTSKGGRQRRKKPQNRDNSDTQERPQPLNHVKHGRPVSTDKISNEKQTSSKQETGQRSRERPKNDMHQRSEPMKATPQRPQLEKNDMHQQAKPVKDAHEQSQPIKRDINPRQSVSNPKQQTNRASSQKKNFNQNRPKSSSTVHNPPSLKSSKQSENRGHANDLEPKIDASAKIHISNNKLPQNKTYQRPHSKNQEKSPGNPQDAPRQKVPLNQLNGPQTRPLKKLDEVKSKPITNGHTMIPNGDAAPKERRQRNPRNRRKGPANEQVNESQVTQ